MHEDADSLNENESKNLELISLPESSHGPGLILPDSKEARDNAEEENPNVYERKLDEKLKDLGLYEDDMTIQQKEELLAVVVVSCETAEQEESRRQLVQDYFDGSQDFTGEGIEFSFQESAWLVDEANLLCSPTLSRDNDLSEDTLKVKENRTNFSPGLFEDEITVVQSPFESQSPSSSRGVKGRRRPPRRGRLKRKIASRPSSMNEIKVAVTHPLSHEDCELDHIDKQIHFQRQKLHLEKSLAAWRPCMSPKEDPLLPSRRKQQSDEEDVPFPCSEQECGQKFMKSFEEFASTLACDQTCNITPLDKPYILLHRGSYAKKSIKLDKFDELIGVCDENAVHDRIEIGIISALEQCDMTSRTNSAFHHVKPNTYNKLYSYSHETKDIKSNNLSHFASSCKTTRSGANYGPQKLVNNSLELENCESPSEVILGDAFQLHNNMVDPIAVPDEHLDFLTSEHFNAISSEEKLPEFSNLRPDISLSSHTCSDNQCNKDGPLLVDNHHLLKLNSDSNFHSSSKISGTEEHLGNLSQRESDSSNSSSLIDVETIVDDEIEEFVVKRKMLPEPSITKYKDSNHAKRMKENAL